MKYVGVDLHKKTLSLCVIESDGGQRRVVARHRFACDDEMRLRDYFTKINPFQAVVEATAAYEWFVAIIEPLAERVVLAHPRKLRVIAESSRKTDRVDAFVLAEFLALDMIPMAHRPTPRLREHRSLIRRRQKIVSRVTSAKNQLRSLLSHYNADCRDLFTPAGQARLKDVPLSSADRFVMEQLHKELGYHQKQLLDVDRSLRKFAKTGSDHEKESRVLLETIPCIGAVTVDVVISELGDLDRFSSQKKVTAYAGLAPGVRSSAGKSHDLGITHAGSRRLRWVLVEAAWRLVARSRHWGSIYERLRQRAGSKKAIVGVARRLLCVMVAMLRSGKAYNLAIDSMG